MADQVDSGSNPQQEEYLKYLYRGSELLLGDRLQEAREALEEAARIDPDDPKCLSLLGLVYFRLDDYEPALRIYDRLVARFPEEASLRVNLGLVYMKQGDDVAAREQMLKAVDSDPTHQRAYGYLGLLHSEHGEHKEAREYFLKAGQEAMVQKMDEAIAADGWGGEPLAATPEGQAASGEAGPQEASPQDEVYAAAPLQPRVPTQELWAEPPESEEDNPAAPTETGVALGSPPPVGPPVTAQVAVPAERMQPIMSDARTSPVAVAFESPLPVPAELQAPMDLEPPVTTPGTPLDTDGGFAEGGDGEMDPEIEEAIDQAVAPAQGWPENELEPEPEDAASRTVASDVPSGSIVPESGLSRTEPQAAGSQASDAREAVEDDGGAIPIFSFATTGLIDMAARRGRMTPSDGVLVFPVEEEAYIRDQGLTAYHGELSFETAPRRVKGHPTEEPMADGRGQFLKVMGEGVLVCDPGDDRLTVLDLFDDYLYLRPEYLFAFESTLHWENGKVRGHSGAIELIHIRGEGRLALVSGGALRKYRLTPGHFAYVSEAALVGWVGRVIPQTLPVGILDGEGVSPAVPMIRCEGEGVILVKAPSPRV